MPTILFDIRSLTFAIDRRPILDRLDLAIQPGESHALLGADGSGKTELAHFIFVRMALLASPIYLG